MRVTETYYKILRAYKDGFRNIILKGGQRSGKSWGAIQASHTIAETSKRHKKISLISHSFPHLRDGLIYDFEQFYANEGRDFNAIHNSSAHNIFINKSVINYFSSDNSGKVYGPARHIAHLNEPNRGITWDAYVAIRGRTTESIILDYNPTGKFWLHKKGVIEDDRSIVITSTFRDNIENLSSDQIQDFIDAYEKSKTDPWWYWWWKVYGEGEDAVLLEERIMPFIKKVAKVPSGAVEIPSALDFGWFPDPTSFCRLFVKKNPNSLKDDLYIQQIIYGTKLSINSKSEGATNLVEKLVEMKINKLHQIIAESADPRAVEDMKQAGFNIEKVKKTSVETSIRSFHDYNIHFVGDSDESYEEFDQYKYKRDKQTNEILSVPDDHQSDHSIDGTRYVLQHRGTRWSV